MDYYSYSSKEFGVIIRAFLLMVYLGFTGFLYAQEKLVIDSVTWFDKGDADVIYKNGRIKGYAFTYQLPKPSKHEYRSVTNLYDINLKNTGKILLNTNETESLLESLYLDDQLICLFMNNKAQKILTRVYNNAGAVIKEYTKKLDDNSLYYFHKNIGTGSTTGQKNQYIFALGENDFVTIIPLKHETIFSYEISIYKEDKEPITYIPDEDTKQEKAEFIGTTGNLLLFHIMSKKVLINNKYESWLLGIDYTNATKKFMVSTLSGKYPYYPTNMASLSNSDGFTILGSYFASDSKIQRSQTTGVCTIQFNNQGYEINRAYQSWEKEIGKYLTVVDTGGINDFGNLYIQNIIPTPKNNYVIVSEGYKKRGDDAALGMSLVSVLAGVAASITTGFMMYPVVGYDYSDFTLTDLAIMEMDSMFTINNVQVFSKETHKTLTYGNDVINKTKIEARRYLSRAFDYDYTFFNDDSASFVVGYRRYFKVNKKESFDYGIIESKNGEYKVHKIPLSSNASFVWGMPAKPGYTIIGEYFLKEQKLQLRLTEINN